MSSDESEIVVPSPRPVAVREIELIDRVEEMRLLREATDRATNGQGGVVFLYGEAGIGKTRLAKELEGYARSRGMQVLSGRCPALFSMDGVPPYVLWEEVIKDYLEVCTPEQLLRVIGSYPIEVSKLVPELKYKLRTFPQSFPLSPENSRDRLFEAVSQFITNISREAPLLVILDDLQWTDRSSLLLLHYLARGVHKESLLLLGAYRDTHVDEKHPLSPVLKELNRERLLQSISLKRMSLDDVVEMIKRILKQDDMPRRFCELVFSKTRGNPFFVEEVIKSLKEEGVISREENRWKVKEVLRIHFPETIKDVVKARIGRLDDESQRILTLASFVGKDFTFEALRGATEVGEEKLVEMMDRMLETGLIEETAIRGEDTYSFADIIVRDVVYEEVSRLKRKRFHGVMGHALEKVYAKKINEHLGELALHFLESGDKEKALDYLLRAGEKAAKVYANSEAASYFQSALKLLEEKEGELQERGHILEKLGDIHKLVGQHEAGMNYWNEALQLWKQLHEKERAARVLRKMANALWEETGDTKKAKKHHDEALKILETEPEGVELANLYQDMAHMYYRTEDAAKAHSWAEKALDLAKKLNDSEAVASSYTSLGTIFGMTGERGKAIECLEKGLQIALDNNYMDTALRAYNNLAGAFPIEEYERSLDCLEKGFELAKKIGNIGLVSFIGNNLASSYIGMGDLNKAVSLAEESQALARKAGDNPTLSFSLNVLGSAYRILGEWDRAEQYYQEALSISQKLKEIDQIAGSYENLGELHFYKEEYAGAKDCFEKAYEVYRKAGAKYKQMSSSVWVASTCIELGELKKAKGLIDNLEEFALKIEDILLVGAANLLRARLLRAQKKWKESVELFEQILQMAEALNIRRWSLYLLARGLLYEYSRVYLERDQEGDKVKAHSLLNQALEIFQKMRAKKDIEKVKSKLFYLETGRRMAERELPVEVSEVALPERITTGYTELDDLLNGGIPRNYAVILTSPSCDERDLLIKNFLEVGVKVGQVTFHIIAKATGTQKLGELFQPNYTLFICNPEADAIVKSQPNVYKLKGVENLTAINIALTSAFRKLGRSPRGPRRACIEIVSDVLLQHHAVQTRKWLNTLIPKLKSKGFTTLAVMDPGMHSPQEVRAVLGLFDGEVNIYEKETEKGAEKFLKIKKMTDQKYSENELPLRKERLKS